MPPRRRTPPKYVRKEGESPRVTLRIKPEVLDMLRKVAEYHEIGYQTYINWLIEEGLRKECAYYGWNYPKPIFAVKGPTQVELDEADRLYRISLNKMRRKRQKERKAKDGE